MTYILSTAFCGVFGESDVVVKGEIKKEQSTQETDENESIVLDVTVDQAVVPGVKLDLQKVAILFREILLDVVIQTDHVVEQKIVLPKLLQTLFVSAIPKNAP